MKSFKLSLLAIAATLSFQSAANAAFTDLGTLTPQETENVFSLFSVSAGDDYQFEVLDGFAFTSSVIGYDVVNFGISLSGPGGFLFGQDTLTPTAPISGFTTAVEADITEKILGAGVYTFSVIGNSTDGGSAYQGSLTVGRAAVAAVPEPQSLAMFMAGLGLLGFATRRKA